MKYFLNIIIMHTIYINKLIIIILDKRINLNINNVFKIMYTTIIINNNNINNNRKMYIFIITYING